MQPVQQLDQRAQLLTRHTREPLSLHVVVLPERVDGGPAPALGQANGHDAPVGRASFTHDQPVSLERVEDTRHAGPRHAGEARDLAWLSGACNEDDKHDPEARPRPT